MRNRYDVAIIGGGIVGLATAYRLLQARPRSRLVILEKEPRLATHQSSHNSGVIHAGLYYRPGSLKARLCTQGRVALEEFAGVHGIPYERCGKLVVALSEEELPRLAELEENGRANGLDLEAVPAERIREIEPHAAGIRAIHVRSTGIIDYRAVSRQLANLLRAEGAEILLGHRVTGIRGRAGGWIVETSGKEIQARGVLGCAGLQADRVADLSPPSISGEDPGPSEGSRIVPFRGDFYTLRPPSRDLVRGLIYPVPDPAFPFLGVHFTRRMDGHVWAGPNAVLAFAREGYRRRDVSIRDLAGTVAFRGFRRLARRHYRMGLGEMWRDWSKRAFFENCRRYVPELRIQDMAFGPSGVRAQLVAQDGSLADDFAVSRSPGIVHVLNAPSPAATASLAIGEMLAGWALESFGLDA